MVTDSQLIVAHAVLMVASDRQYYVLDKLTNEVLSARAEPFYHPVYAINDHEQPLIVAAVGIALGAAVAALLPRTQAEDLLMGETSDVIKGAVSDAAAEQYQQTKTAAENVVAEAKASATRHGLSAAGAADAVRTITDKVVSPIGKGSESETPPAAGS